MLWLLLLGAKNPDETPKLDLNLHVMEIEYDAERPQDSWKRYEKETLVMYDFNGQKDDSYGMVFDMYLRRMVWPPDLQEEPDLPWVPASISLLHQVSACYVESMVQGIYGGKRSGDGWRIHKRAVKTAFGSLLSRHAQDCNPQLRLDLAEEAPVSTAAGFEIRLDVETRRENHRGQTTPLLRLKVPEYIEEHMPDVPKPYVEISVAHPPERYTSTGGTVPLRQIERFSAQAERALWACYTQSAQASEGPPPVGEVTLELQVDSLGGVVSGRLAQSTPGLEETGLCFIQVYQQLILPAPLGQTENVVELELPVAITLGG